MKKTLFFLLAIIAVFISCDSTTDEIGGTIIDYEDNIIYTETTYNVSTRSVVADSISARSAYAYLGRLWDPETDVTMSANYMTQFAMHFYDTNIFKSKDSLIVKDPTCMADTCYIAIVFQNFYGDSLAKMQLVAHELDRPYEEENRYPISFNPAEAGMLRQGGLTEVCSFSVSSKPYEGHNVETSSHVAFVVLRDKYTAKDGTVYNNYGSYLMDMYYKHPDYFKSSALFKENVCPGFYFETISGQGALGQVYSTMLGVRYRCQINGKDSVASATLAGTKEVIVHNTLSDDAKADSALVELANQSDFTLVKSPVGIYTEMTLNVDSILSEEHDEDTLSAVRIFIPSLNSTVETKYELDPPATLLMVRADSVFTFFNKEKLPDSYTSFTASYTSSTNGYTFGNIANLVTTMYEERRKACPIGSSEELQQYNRAHPKWNKVYLVPVETTSSTTSSSSTSTVLTSVSHSMALESTRLRRGTEQNSPIKASVIYSRYKSDDE